jgi:DNA-binding XRE family transcriptional regulator
MKVTLKMLRASKNMTQADLAAVLDVNRKTVIAWENGKYFPAVDMIDAICEFFEVSYDDIKWRP